MKVTNRFASIGSFCLVLLAFPSSLLAATCTSIASGNWGTAATWSCGARPAAGDTVIITSPFTVTLNNNYSATNLTIDAGGTLVDAGNDLTMSGNAIVNGTYDGSGNNGELIMAGAGTTLSGTGTFIDIKRVRITGNVTIPAVSSFTMTQQSELRVDGTLNLNGTISGAGQTPGNRILRVDNAPATLNIGATGVIDAPNSVGEIRSGGTATNGGSANLQSLTTQGTGTWTNTAGSSCNAPPTCTVVSVTSINVASANPAEPNSVVSWTVIFNQSVTGVDITDFTLVQGGGVSGASITSVVNSTGGVTTDSSWTVTANTGTGNTGTLGLNLVDDDTIINAATEMLGGAGLGNGNFTGQVYTISLLNHVQINAPTSAMTFGEVSVTISPHTAAHIPISSAGAVSLSTSTGQGDWVIGSGAGTLTPGAANSGLATYTFGAGESVASLGFIHQTAATVTLNVATTTGADLLLNTPPAELANTISFTAPSFVFTDSPCVHNIAFGTAGQTCVVLNWSPQIAGVDVANIYITSINAAGIPTRLSRTRVRTRSMAFGLTCHNPAANAGMIASFAGVALPVCAANGTQPTIWSTAVTATFPAGVPSAGPYAFNYPDVGKVELWTHHTAATTQLGSSNPFVVAPHHFGFSVVTAVPALPFKAGNDFSATVTAYNGLPTPTATANFGQETPTAESATISFSKCQPTGISSVNGAFTGTLGAFTGGAASSANLNWSEVGNGDLVATLTSGSYLGSGLTATGNTSASGTVCQDAGSNPVAGVVGPFVPDHFDTALADGCAGCGFTYSGQPFTVYVTAKNASGVKTANYDGSANTTPNFAKAVTLSAWDAATGVTANPGGGLTNTTVAASDFTGGLATVNAANVGPATLAPIYTFSAVTVPTPIRIRAADADATSSGFTEGTTEVRTGRWRILNAAGSELLPLGMTASVQYYDAAGSWVTSATDSATTFDTSADIVAAIINGPLAAVSVKNAGIVNVASGKKTFTLNAPGVTGVADISLSAPGYLLAGSNGAGNQSIAGRVTFGVYGGVPHLIYQREKLQ